MSDRKVIKFKKRYLITVEGKSDTVHPDNTPVQLKVIDKIFKTAVDATNGYWKLTSVDIKELDNE